MRFHHWVGRICLWGFALLVYTASVQAHASATLTRLAACAAANYNIEFWRDADENHVVTIDRRDEDARKTIAVSAAEVSRDGEKTVVRLIGNESFYFEIGSDSFRWVRQDGRDYLDNMRDARCSFISPAWSKP